MPLSLGQSPWLSLSVVQPDGGAFIAWVGIQLLLLISCGTFRKLHSLSFCFFLVTPQSLSEAHKTE